MAWQVGIHWLGSENVFSTRLFLESCWGSCRQGRGFWLEGDIVFPREVYETVLGKQ